MKPKRTPVLLSTVLISICLYLCCASCRGDVNPIQSHPRIVSFIKGSLQTRSAGPPFVSAHPSCARTLELRTSEDTTVQATAKRGTSTEAALLNSVQPSSRRDSSLRLLLTHKPKGFASRVGGPRSRRRSLARSPQRKPDVGPSLVLPTDGCAGCGASHHVSEH
jgi:hypothetical protein